MKSTTKNGAVLASALAAAVALSASACSSSKDAKAGAAGATGGTPAASSAAADTCPNGSVRMGIEPYDDPAKLIPLYNKVASALGAKLHCTVKVTISDSYVAEILAMKNGQLDIGEFGPLGYVFAKEQAGAIPVASFADAGGRLSSYTGGIWVKKGSPITSVAQLAGHTLALSSPGSTSGDAIPRKALIDAGVDKKVTVQYAGGHTQSLLALTNGKVDAAEVNSQTAVSATKAGQFDASQYTEIFKSDPIANDPITVSPKTSAAFQAAVKDALLSLTKDDVAGLGDFAGLRPAGQAADRRHRRGLQAGVRPGPRAQADHERPVMSEPAGFPGSAAPAGPSGPAGPPALAVRGLTMAYSGRTVLSGLDLDVRAGELVSILGANGSGKSTALRCVAGLARPTVGTVAVSGRPERPGPSRPGGGHGVPADPPGPAAQRPGQRVLRRARPAPAVPFVVPVGLPARAAGGGHGLPGPRRARRPAARARRAPVRRPAAARRRRARPVPEA